MPGPAPCSGHAGGCTVVPAGPPARGTLLALGWTLLWCCPMVPAIAFFKPCGCTLLLKITFHFIILYKVEELLGISYGVSI